jgi:hypothetical protein
MDTIYTATISGLCLADPNPITEPGTCYPPLGEQPQFGDYTETGARQRAWKYVLKNNVRNYRIDVAERIKGEPE